MMRSFDEISHHSFSDATGAVCIVRYACRPSRIRYVRVGKVRNADPATAVAHDSTYSRNIQHVDERVFAGVKTSGGRTSGK